jgi:hypothetical protein
MAKRLRKALYCKILMERDRVMENKDITEDGRLKHSILGTVPLGRVDYNGKKIPYALNVYDRDYLITAGENVIIEKEAR